MEEIWKSDQDELLTKTNFYGGVQKTDGRPVQCGETKQFLMENEILKKAALIYETK